MTIENRCATCLNNEIQCFVLFGNLRHWASGYWKYSRSYLDMKRITEHLGLEGSWRSPTNPSAKAGSSGAGGTGSHIQVGCECLQWRRSHSLLGSLFQCSAILKVFLTFRWNVLCFSLCLLSCVLSLGTTEKGLGPSSWHLPWRYLYASVRTPLGHLFLKLNKLQPFHIRNTLQSPNYFCCLLPSLLH